MGDATVTTLVPALAVLTGAGALLAFSRRRGRAGTALAAVALIAGLAPLVL